MIASPPLLAYQALALIYCFGALSLASLTMRLHVQCVAIRPKKESTCTHVHIYMHVYRLLDQLLDRLFYLHSMPIVLLCCWFRFLIVVQKITAWCLLSHPLHSTKPRSPHSATPQSEASIF